MNVSSKIFLGITAAAALSVARPALGNLMTCANQLGNFADRTLSTDASNTSLPWTPNGSDDVARLKWQDNLDKLLMMRRDMRNELVRPPLDPPPNPVQILPVPMPPQGVGVPDGGSTLIFLGFALLGISALRLRLSF
jgi:hypothetical protein